MADLTDVADGAGAADRGAVASVTEPVVVVRGLSARHCAELVRWLRAGGEAAFQQWLVDRRQATLDALPGLADTSESFAALESLDLEKRVHLFLIDMAEARPGRRRR